MTQKDRDEILLRVQFQIDEIHKSLARDYKILHGNGQPGLLSRVQSLEDFHKNENTFTKKFGGAVAWLLTTAIAIYSLIKH